MKNIAVFFGGTSVEREVSVITGVLTLNSIDKSLYNPVPVYIAGDGKWYTGEVLRDIEFFKKLDFKKLERVAMLGGENNLYRIRGKKLQKICSIAVAINCIHGERGEDGCLAGVMDMNRIPLASPSILPSAVSMDKDITKTFLKGLGVKTLPCVTITDANDLQEKTAKIGFPMIVKPARLGSSIGIARADDLDTLTRAVNLALRYGDRVIVEKCLDDFIEINCAVYKNSDGELKVSECERPICSGKLLSFDDKYTDGNREFPADIPKKISDGIKQTTKKVYDALCFDGVIRIDYMLKGESVYLNEINAVPGSLAYYLFSDTLKGFSDTLNQLILSAERKFAEKSTFITEFGSSILDLKGVKSAKKR